MAMNFAMKASAILVLGGLLVALTGCPKPEGPAEKAGKQVDKAVEQVGQQVQKAGDSIEDAAKGKK